jgi:hypothetical protein
MNSTLKTTLRASLILAFVILLPSVANAHTQKAITVQGTNTYPQDVIAVQMALNQYEIVTLKGTFNFGQAVFGVDYDTGQITGTPAGSVYMSRPNVVLEADKRTGATIVGGGAPFSSEYFDAWPVIGITAPDITVRDLVMYGSPDMGIFFLGNPQTARGKKLTISANTISAEYPIFLYYTGGLRAVVNRNQLTSLNSQTDLSAPLIVGWSGYTPDASGQLVPAKGSVEITNNEISVKNPNVPGEFDGMRVFGWGVGNWNRRLFPGAHFYGVVPPLPPGTNPADWGDNGPITISGNIFTMDCPPDFTAFCTAIQVGRSANGANHVRVVNNTIKGTAGAGIDKWSYGHNNLIAWNDLTELTTLFEQIGVMARGTAVAYNRLGAVMNAPALWITSINWHPSPQALDTPMPLPTEYCLTFENDYRRTGLPGWPQGGGAILLASEADAQWYTGVGTEVRYNLVAETGKFPDGTGPNEQVYQLQVGDEPLVHDNWILGLSQTDSVSTRGAQSFDNAFRPMAQERVRRLQNRPWK